MSSVVPPAASSYAFGDVVVDTRAHRVTRGGVDVPLEPKAYDVLLALLREPGGVVSRDALLDAVWGHRHVTPAVLNRVIALLRKALGDDADHPHLIRTVHGTGYAFIGELAPARVDQTDARVRGNDGGGREPTARVVAAEPAAPVPAHEDLESVTEPPASPLTGRMRFYAVLALVVAVAVAATWTIAQRWPVEEAGVATSAEPAANGTIAPAATSLALLPPHLDAQDAQLRALTFAYVDGLRDALARLPGITVAGSDSARIALLTEQEPAKVGRMLGAEHVLVTSLAREGESIALALALVRVADAQELWRERYVQAPELLFRTIGPVLDGVAKPMSSERVADPVLAAPPSAQDLYWRAIIEQQTGSQAKAQELFEQALAIEPRYAMAYVGIARSWRNRALAREIPLGEAAAKGRVAVARALELAPDLVPAHIMDAGLLTMQWRATEAEIPVRRARSLEPDNLGVLSVTANLAGYAHRPDEALALRPRIAQLDPLSPYTYVLWARDLAMAGNLDAARAKIREALAIDPNATFALDNDTRLLAAYGRFDEAIANHQKERPEGDIYASLTIATIRTAFGQYDEAQAAIDEFARGGVEPPAFASTVLELAWTRGRFEEALAWIEGEGSSRVQEPWRTVNHARALALAGRRDEARELYRQVFGDPGNRDLLASSLFALHGGIVELANWAALEREAGGGTAETEDYARRLEAMVAGGFAMPVLQYYRAVEALLRDDVAAADAALGRAIEQGWRDRIALDSDLAWTPHASSEWLAKHRAAIDASLDAMRRKDADSAADEPRS